MSQIATSPIWLAQRKCLALTILLDPLVWRYVFHRTSFSANSAAVGRFGDFIGHNISFNMSIDIGNCKFAHLSLQAISVRGDLNARIIVAQTTFVP